MSVMIIAEAGVNHNGSIELAKKLIDVAAEARADFVKFQTFKAETLVTQTADKAEYQKEITNTNESQFDMLKKLELDYSDHKKLINHCRARKINFLSTAFDHDSIEFLYELGISLFKVPSGELTNLPYLRIIGSKGLPVILSTGMGTLKEVESAAHVLIGSGTNKKDLTILHCNTDYPTQVGDVNLNAMLSMRDKLDLQIDMLIYKIFQKQSTLI